MSETTPTAEDSILLTEVQDHVLVITLNRPEARNAFNRALSQKMSATMDRLDEDPELRIGIITGANNTFSSGMDLKAMLQGERAGTAERGGFGIMTKPSNKPLIAAVEGYAVAGGCELALSCDLSVAADNSKWGLPEVRRGLVAVGGALFRLPKRIPYHLVMELALSGEIQEARRFYELGLINRIVEPGKALEAALEVAKMIAANGPLAISAAKQIIQKAFEWKEEEAWKNQSQIANIANRSEDAKEGARAFAEKRPPVWKGK